MALGTVSPVGIQQFHDNNGDPLAGGKLWFYEAGTSTLTPAYADVNLTTALSNPVILDAAGRAPELFLSAISYKQVLQDALGATVWTADNIGTAAALRNTFVSISLTGLQHNVPIPAGIITYVDLRNAEKLTITGFSGGAPGQILILRAFGVGQVDLLNTNSGSQVTNQLMNFIASGPTSITGVGASGVGPAGSAVYVKVANGYWLLVSHCQGSWIRVPYAAGNFLTLGGPGGVWTVEAADVSQLDYQLNGASLLISIALKATVITGAPTGLRIQGFPYTWKTGAGYLPAFVVVAPNLWADGAPGFMVGGPDVNVLDFARATFEAMGAGAAEIYAQGTLDVK